MKKLFNFQNIIAVSSIVLTIVLYLISNNIKEISFKTIAITELVSDKNTLDKSIKVFFDEKQVFNLYSISSTISNTGNVPITKSDLLNPLKIEFQDSIKILRFSIIPSPSNIKLERTLGSENQLIINPDLLNPKDNIHINFYVTSPNKNILPKIESRIIGGEVFNIELNEEFKQKSEFKNKIFASFEGMIYWMSLIYTAIYILIVFWAIYIQKETGIQSTLSKFLAFFFMTLGLLCSILYLIQTK